MIARASQLFLPTLREPPADAEAVNHKLLVRGAFVRQLTAGVWTFLPLGWRGRGKIDIIFHLEDRKGAEFVLPMTHEETVTWTARELQSYRQLPQMLYHFS